MASAGKLNAMETEPSPNEPQPPVAGGKPAPCAAPPSPVDVSPPDTGAPPAAGGGAGAPTGGAAVPSGGAAAPSGGAAAPGGGAAAPAPTLDPQAQLRPFDKQVYEVKFGLTRNAMYHASRARFFNGLNRICNFIIILLGTSVAAQVVSSASEGVLFLGIATTAVATLQLVFDFGGSYFTHSYLQKKYFEILAHAEKLNAEDSAGLSLVRENIAMTYAEEPPAMWALNAISYNEAAEYFGKATTQYMSAPFKEFFGTFSNLARQNSRPSKQPPTKLPTNKSRKSVGTSDALGSGPIKLLA
jgi:hypothetical protein